MASLKHLSKEEILNTFLLANIPEMITQEEFDDVKKSIRELQHENKKYKEVIDRAIKLIEDTYYSKNTTDIDSIVWSSDKLIKVREILKEVE